MYDGFRTTVNKLYYRQYSKLYTKRGMFHVKHPYLVIWDLILQILNYETLSSFKIKPIIPFDIYNTSTA